MELSNIPKLVENLWEFLWPPVINLLMVWFVLRFISPVTTEKIKSKISLSRLKLFTSERFQKEIKSYGLPNLIPFISLFLVVFILYVVQVGITNIGRFLPGHVVSCSGPLMAHVCNDNEIANFLKHWPKTSGFDELSNNINGIAKLKPKDGTVLNFSDENVNYWNSENGKEQGRLSTTKFFMLWTFVCLFFGFFIEGKFLRPLICFLILELVLFSVATIFLVLTIYGIEQHGFALKNQAQFIFSIDSTDEKIIKTEKADKAFLSKVKDWRSENDKSDLNWWRFELFDYPNYYWLSNVVTEELKKMKIETELTQKLKNIQSNLP